MTAMGEQHNFFIDPDTLGNWVGEIFVFEEPFMLRDANGGEYPVQQINTTGMVLQDGITRDDVVHAMINSTHAESRFDPDHDE